MNISSKGSGINMLPKAVNMLPHLLQDGPEVHGNLDDLVVTHRDGLGHGLLEPAVAVHLRHRRPRRLQRLRLSADASNGGTRRRR